MQLQIDISNLQVTPPNTQFPIVIPKVGPVLLDLDPANIGAMAAGTTFAKHEIILPDGKKIVISFDSAHVMAMNDSIIRVSQCVAGGGMCQESFTYAFALNNATDNSIQIMDTTPPGGVNMLFDWGVRCDITAGSK